MMYCDSYLVYLKLSINPSEIWSSVFYVTSTENIENFMYQSSARPLRVVIICTFFIASSWTYCMVHTASHRNQCCSGSSNTFLLNIDNLISFPGIILTPVILGKQVWLAELPCLLFATLVLLVFTKPLGDEFLDLTFSDVREVVGVSYSCSGSGAYAYSSSLLDISWYSFSSSWESLSKCDVKS